MAASLSDKQLAIKVRNAQAIDELQDHIRFRLDDAFHHDPAGSIPCRRRNAFLVHIQAAAFTSPLEQRCHRCR